MIYLPKSEKKGFSKEWKMIDMRIIITVFTGDCTSLSVFILSMDPYRSVHSV